MLQVFLIYSANYLSFSSICLEPFSDAYLDLNLELTLINQSKCNQDRALFYQI